jgi:5-formyltetrahydrofolate cyclo-ligase
MLERILAVPAEARRIQADLLSRRFASLPGLEAAGTILLYLSAFPEEVPTRGLCDQARAMGKRILLPRIARRPRRLQLFEVADLDSDLEAGVMGISEPRRDLPELPPEAVDWALIPGLAFDLDGYRLGRGGGYYDRLIPRFRADAVCWAFGFDCQLAEELPREPHDAPLNGVTLPSKSYSGIRTCSD